MKFFKDNSLYILFSLILIIIIAPLLIYGDFQQDDFYILSLQNKNFVDSFSIIFTQFSNRPFAAIFFSIISRFFYSYEIYFLSHLILVIISCNFVIKSFEEYFISKFSKVLFLILCLIPIYSYSVIYSTAMQITGNLSVFLWSISIFFLNKYLKTDKIFYLIISNTVLLLMFLTYESAFPLIILNFFLPIIKRKLPRLRISIILIFLVLILSLVIQKNIIPYFFNKDISRLRIESLDFNNFILYLSGNILLVVNIFYIFFQNFFESIKIILNSYLLIFQYLISLSLFYLLISFNFKENYKVDVKKISIFQIALIVFLFFLMLIFMHIIAKSAINIYGINNRALVSLSFFIPLVLIFLLNVTAKKNFTLIISAYVILVITNYIPIQYNNIKYILERNTSIEEIMEKIKNNDDEEVSLFIYLDTYNNNSLYRYTTYVNDNFDFKNIIPLKSQMLGRNKNFWGGSITKDKFCNKNYWDLHWRSVIYNKFNISKQITFIEKNKSFYELKNFHDLNNFDIFLNKKISCINVSKRKVFLNKAFGKTGNKDFINNSILIKKFVDYYISFNLKY